MSDFVKHFHVKCKLEVFLPVLYLVSILKLFSQILWEDFSHLVRNTLLEHDVDLLKVLLTRGSKLPIILQHVFQVLEALLSLVKLHFGVTEALQHYAAGCS